MHNTIISHDSYFNLIALKGLWDICISSNLQSQILVIMSTTRICQAIVKKTNEPCTKKAHDGCQFCGIHMPKKQVEKPVEKEETVPVESSTTDPDTVETVPVKKPTRTKKEKPTAADTKEVNPDNAETVKIPSKPKRATKKATEEQKIQEKPKVEEKPKVDEIANEVPIGQDTEAQIDKLFDEDSPHNNESPKSPESPKAQKSPEMTKDIAVLTETVAQAIESQFVFEPGQISKDLFEALYQELMRTR